MLTFFEHSCFKCGIVDEYKFTYAGPHIKQVCNNCGAYVKFFDKNKIPDIKEIKLKIWHLTNQDLTVISFLNGKMMYWKLYLTALSNMNKLKT
jgi:hypothetical protein